MRTHNWGIVGLASVVGLGAALMASEPVASDPGHGPGAAPAHRPPVVRPGNPGYGGRPTRPQDRLKTAAHELDRAAAALLEVMVEEAHHQGESREDRAEVAGIMAAGSLAGQASALHKMAHDTPDANLRHAARHFFATLDGARAPVHHAHVTREVRLAWRAVQDRSDRLEQQFFLGLRRRGPFTTPRH